ncbi:DUF3237 domain-containing protein [Nocardia spumae]|uniref:DUF3237 domain-containing protein n=1 Tax=Nocardia spumae TaxID=2887190 RepID=UPI001D136E47|nr:DUF3237 domain-containing protein [Nocardia spumae]
MTLDARVRTVEPLRTTTLFDIVVDLRPRVEFGVDGPVGRRVLYGAAGGSFRGPRLGGEVLAQGGDWALFRTDGTMMLDVRLALRTEDEALIHMSYGGRWAIPPQVRDDMATPAGRLRVDPADYYFRINPVFETGSERYRWLNDVVAVGTGYLVEGGVAYHVEQIL